MQVLDINNPEGEKKQIVYLELHEFKAIIQTLHNLAYNKRLDIFELPTEIIDLGEKLEANK